MKRQSKVLFKILCLGAILGAGCGKTEESQTSGYVSRGDDQWQTRSIDVCFTQMDPALDSAKAIIARGINEEYGKVGFRFNFVPSCGARQAIRVTFINGATSQVDQIGSGVRTVSLGAHHECYSASGSPIEYLNSVCVRNVAVHEFGHVLGLHHEMNRRDNNDQCELDQTHGLGESGAIQIGDYDSSSVMNYCQVMRMNNRNQLMPLSRGDLSTLKALYEGPVASVDSLPSARPGNITAISFRVRGRDVSEYQLKFGYRNGTDCKNPSGYSPFLPTSYLNTGSEMVQAFLGSNSVGSGEFRICLIGRNGSRTQPYESYSSIDMTVP